MAAMAGITVSCPFDVIKTRLQSSRNYASCAIKTVPGGTPSALISSPNSFVSKGPYNMQSLRNVPLVGVSNSANARTLITDTVPYIFRMTVAATDAKSLKVANVIERNSVIKILV